ncbi:MAG: hypothetical protein ACPF8V_01175 [Luteibaculum sp.]
MLFGLRVYLSLHMLKFNLDFMKRLLFLCIALFCFACAPTEKQAHEIVLSLKGEMLFSGANTLQMPVKHRPNNLVADANLGEVELESVGVNKVSISLTEEQHRIVESVLLQVVSDQNEMITLGTLSPLPDGTTFDLKLAEDLDLLPYFKDNGGAWVLDINLSEDYMDEMQVDARLNLSLNYTDK